MSGGQLADTTEAPEADPGSAEGRGRWADPAVPVGNAPAQPFWPVYLFGAAWLAWLGFLVAMIAVT